MKKYSILFVCTFWGVRSKIAKLLLDAKKHPSLESYCVGFETGKVGSFVVDLMSERGFSLETQSPPTVFDLAKNNQSYDYVVSLSSKTGQETQNVLLMALAATTNARIQRLNWDISDFMSIAREAPDIRAEKGGAIIKQIEDHIDEFLKGLDKPEATSAS